MTAGPTVTRAAEALVGTVTAVTTSDPVSLRQVREYVAGTGGDPEIRGHPEDPAAPVIAPPLFFLAACRPILAETDLLPDGQYPTLGVPRGSAKS